MRRQPASMSPVLSTTMHPASHHSFRLQEPMWTQFFLKKIQLLSCIRSAKVWAIQGIDGALTANMDYSLSRIAPPCELRSVPTIRRLITTRVCTKMISLCQWKVSHYSVRPISIKLISQIRIQIGTKNSQLETHLKSSFSKISR